MDISELQSSVEFVLNVDACNLQITVGIEEWSKTHYLHDYTYGNWTNKAAIFSMPIL